MVLFILREVSLLATGQQVLPKLLIVCSGEAMGSTVFQYPYTHIEVFPTENSKIRRSETIFSFFFTPCLKSKRQRHMPHELFHPIKSYSNVFTAQAISWLPCFCPPNSHFHPVLPFLLGQVTVHLQ